jgi:hypothetical protein
MFSRNQPDPTSSSLPRIRLRITVPAPPNTTLDEHMKPIKKLSSLALLACAAALTGCSSDAPSSSEAKAAVQAEMDKEMAAFVEIAGAKAGEAMRSSLPDLKAVEVVSCEKVQEKTSRCVVKMEVSMMGQTKTDTFTISFAKGSDGKWVAMR